MKISAFTYVRNGKTFGYPFIESIKSLLPIVDEYIVVVGDSSDGTREAVENIGNDKIKIERVLVKVNDKELFIDNLNIYLEKNVDIFLEMNEDEVIDY